MSKTIRGVPSTPVTMASAHALSLSNSGSSSTTRLAR
jgi:hypothetical protein